MSATAAMRRRLPRSVVVGLVVLAAFGAIWWAAGEVRLQEAASADGGELVFAQADGSADEVSDDDVVAVADLDVTYDVFLARDPFESVRPPEPVVGDADDPTLGDPTVSDRPINGGAQNGSTSTDPSVPDSKDSTGPDGLCVTGTEAVCNGRVVVLDSITATSATIQVNGVSYVVAPGQQFAGAFQLLRLSGNCVEVLYLEGDEADVFSLCEGDTVAK